MRKLLALLVLVVGPLLYLVRRRVPPGERVHLYYDDGSMVTLEPGAEADRLLTLARAAL